MACHSLRLFFTMCRHANIVLHDVNGHAVKTAVEVVMIPAGRRASMPAAHMLCCQC